MFVRSALRRLGQKFTFEVALKFGVMFQKFALNLLNCEIFMEKISGKCKFFMKFFIFCERCGDEIRIIIHTDYNGWFEGEKTPPRAKKVFENFIKT